MEIALALLKLALGLAAFTLIGYIGTRDKRVTGILLTFPILNGIAILTAADPFAVARPIYPLAMFNTVLFATVITWCAFLPPLAARTLENTKVVLRVAVWTLAWLAATTLLTLGRDRLPSVWVLFVIQLGVGVIFVSLYWTRARPAAEAIPADRPRDFLAFWSGGAALARIALFVAAFAILLGVSYRFESHWIGMASSLPLPGLFAIATLSVTQPDLRAIRDTVFLGPLLVIPFNESFAFAVSHLPQGASGVPIGIAVLIAMWVVAAALVFLLVPKLARWLDRS